MRTMPSPSRSAVSIESAGLRVDRPAVRRTLGAFGCLRVADDIAVHHDLDAVALVLVEGRRVADVDDLAVHPDPDEALLGRSFEDTVALGLAILDERPEHEQPGALRQGEDLVHDLLDGLPLDRVAVRAMRDADPGEQEPEVVVDLGHGPDGGSGIAAGALLVDGDRRREAVDLVDIGLLHLAEELAGVRGQALDVAALALGIDGVEGEAGLTASRQAGDHDQPITREGDGHILEVVLARATNDDLVLGHTPPVYRIEAKENTRSRPCRVHIAGIGLSII